MPNRLAEETSPYLLQHAENPVDWFPWGAEALERSRKEQKPIFLSIGYAACHWCHVMEHESFEDEHIAELLNRAFVPIKVDREERPDLDQVYMNAVQLMTGHGGWPMSVFLTPDLQPFHAGTYWPPEPRGGMPGFSQVLEAVAEAWGNRREEAIELAGRVTDHLRQVVRPSPAAEAPTAALMEAACRELERGFDFTHGGFGSAPKFPHPMNLRFLLRCWLRTGRAELLKMVQLNLDKMAQGGIYDHLAGGFARYSVDSRWRVPHFEKMLYDNASLSSAYLEAYQVTGQDSYARVVRETCDYVLDELQDPEGGFHSSEDADSEGEEGKFYLWTPDEIAAVLGTQRAERFCRVYDVTEGGNFEGRNILHLARTPEQCAAQRGWDARELEEELAASRRALRAARARRVRPGRDDKVLTSWNALMIEALARAAGPLAAPRYLQAAQRAAAFLCTQLRRGDGRLLRAWRRGRARFDAYLDDYAALILALVSLYQADFQEHWIDEAVGLADTLLEHFADPKDGGFYYVADDHEPLIARQKDNHDSSIPSGNGLAATALLQLGQLCGRTDYAQAAEATLAMASRLMQGAPLAAGQLWLAADTRLGPSYEVVLAGGQQAAGVAELLSALRIRFLPHHLLAARQSTPASRSTHLESLFQGKAVDSGEPIAYLCEQFACREPAVGRAAILRLWDEMGRAPSPGG